MASNGDIPLERFVRIGDRHYIAPGTLVRWRALVADVLANEGVTLIVTPPTNDWDGWNIYRPRSAQRIYRQKLGMQAAVEGYSTHGGVLGGVEVLAIDVYNWAAIGQAKFYAYARKHDFEPGVIPGEPWHIIDRQPWVIPAGADQSASAPNEEDDMTPDQDKLLRAIHALVTQAEKEASAANDAATWTKNRIGGTNGGSGRKASPTLTDQLEKLRDAIGDKGRLSVVAAAHWLIDALGGSNKASKGYGPLRVAVKALLQKHGVTVSTTAAAEPVDLGDDTPTS